MDIQWFGSVRTSDARRSPFSPFTSLRFEHGFIKVYREGSKLKLQALERPLRRWDGLKYFVSFEEKQITMTFYYRAEDQFTISQLLNIAKRILKAL